MHKAKTEIKDKNIIVRCTKAEHSNIKAKAKTCEVTMSELLLKGANHSRPFKIKDRKSMQAQTCELARIGSNLNQIARWCNKHKSSADAVQVIQVLIGIQNSLASFPIAQAPQGELDA